MAPPTMSTPVQDTPVTKSTSSEPISTSRLPTTTLDVELATTAATMMTSATDRIEAGGASYPGGAGGMETTAAIELTTNHVEGYLGGAGGVGIAATTTEFITDHVGADGGMDQDDSASANDVWVLGDVVLRRCSLVFDFEHSQIGFACSKGGSIGSIIKDYQETNADFGSGTSVTAANAALRGGAATPGDAPLERSEHARTLAQRSNAIYISIAVAVTVLGVAFSMMVARGLKRPAPAE